MLKKSISILLALIIVVGVFTIVPFSVSAATSGTTGDCTWTLDGTVLTISGNGVMDDYMLMQSVVAPWYDYRQSIKSVIFTNGVTSIGAGTCAGCSSLANVTIPVTVTRIGRDAFQDCTALNSIIIPDSVTVFGQSVFSGCTSLNSINLSNSVTELTWCEFANCTGLTSVVIPESVTGISIGAFSECTGLTSVTIPKSMTRISDNAFYKCSSIKDVYYNGTKEDWERITIGTDGNEYLLNANILYGSHNNELDFSKDVWHFRNFSESKCYLEDEVSNGYYKNPYIDKLKPSNRAAVEENLESGSSNGHCLGMSATVILQKLGLEDYTMWDGVDCLRKVSKNGIPKSRICYYQALRCLWDINYEVQRFQRNSDERRLEILAERADNVKRGGNPVLLIYGNEKTMHALVAYALEEGSFVSSTTGKQYDHRILVYDCNSTKDNDKNNVIWSEDYCLLFNKGTDEWEIPHYVNKGVKTGEADLMCAIVDTRCFDAVDDLEQIAADTNPVILLDSQEKILMKNESTGEQWIIDTVLGKANGSSELLCYRDIGFNDTSESDNKLNVVMPDSESVYVFETESGKTADIDLSVLYIEKYLSIESESAKGAVISPDGIAAITGNSGEYEIVAADNSMQAEQKYDTFSVKGSNLGDTTLSLSDNTVNLEGDNIKGVVVEASNEKDTGTKNIVDKNIAELSNDMDEYETVIKPEPSTIIGDTDGNHRVEAIDATWIQRFLAQIEIPYIKEGLMQGDADGDGELEIIDVTAIQSYLAEISIPYLIGVEVV